jgi:hypothetical protein
MRPVFAVALGGALLALAGFATSGGSSRPGHGVQRSVRACLDPGRPLLGITEPGGGRRRTLSEPDRLTLRPVSSSRLRLDARAEGPVTFSPGCERLAIGTGDAGLIALVDAREDGSSGRVPWPVWLVSLRARRSR